MHQTKTLANKATVKDAIIKVGTISYINLNGYGYELARGKAQVAWFGKTTRKRVFQQMARDQKSRIVNEMITCVTAACRAVRY